MKLAELKAALAPWTEEYELAGMREGWVLSTTSGAQELIQCQKLDAPEDFEDIIGSPLPYLEDDGAAWDIVMRGDSRHHLVARAILQQYSPTEYANMVERAKAA